MEELLQAFGARIRAVRLAAGLTQDALAAASGLTAKYISELENGRANPSLASIHSLAEKGFGMPVAALFSYDVSPTGVGAAMAQLRALLGAQPEAVQRRILHVIQALIEPLPE